MILSLKFYWMGIRVPILVSRQFRCRHISFEPVYVDTFVSCSRPGGRAGEDE